MKSFKIKKRSQRQPIFIMASMAFSKPRIPCWFFAKIHMPLVKKPTFSYEIVVQDVTEQVDSTAAVLPDSSNREWSAVRNYVAAQEGLAVDSDQEHLSPNPEVVS